MNPVTIPITELKPALAGLGKIINKRPTSPVLGCVRLERTRTGSIELAATDLDTAAVVRLETSAQGDPIVFLVPYEDLNNAAKSCGRQDALIIAPGAENRIAIRFPVGGQMIEHRCESWPVADFPIVPAIRGEPIPLDEPVRRAIQDAFGCASVDPTRPILNAVFLDVSKSQGHYVVATDGSHLFSSNSFALPLKDSLIIGSHRFLSWREFSNDGDWTLRTTAANNDQPPQFEIASNRWRFVTQSMEGSYPNWRAVVPDSGSVQTMVEFDPSSISEVIQTIARMPDHDPVYHAIGLEVIGRRAWLLGKSPNAENWTRFELKVTKAAGPDVKIFLNRQFFTKALRFGLTRIEIIDPLTPLRFSNGGRQLIVMPVRTESQRTPSQSIPSPAAQAPVINKPTETRKPMPETHAPVPTVSTEKPPAAVQKPALDLALSHIEAVKTHHRDAIRGLTELTDLLKQAVREQRAGEKEVQVVRQTLRSLQSVRI